MRSITMIFEDTMLKDNSINSTDKLVYGIIGVLANTKGYCYANNDYLSKQLNLSKRTITNSIGKMNHPAAEQTGYHKVLQHQV